MKKTSSTVKNKEVSFLREWARRPLSVAAIAPSGASLARLITSELDAQTGPVIELGPGTGVFTQAILKRGIRASDLVMVELNQNFAAHLGEKFPEARVVNAGAQTLAEGDILNGRKAGAIVSGLGLLSMPHEVVWDIMRGVEQHLAPGGSFYQFTYGWRCPVPKDILEDLNLTSCTIGRTARNLPPATVYKVKRALDAEQRH